MPSCLPVSPSSGLTCENRWIYCESSFPTCVSSPACSLHGWTVQMSDIESESSFSRKPWGIDFPELLDGNIQINMNHGSDMHRKIGWLIPIQRFCTSPQVLPAPAGWCPQWRIQVTTSAGYHMSHANTCHMLSAITFVCVGECLDDTPIYSQNHPKQIFLDIFASKGSFFKSCEADQPHPIAAWLQRLKW